MSFRGAAATRNLTIFALLKISPVGRNDKSYLCCHPNEPQALFDMMDKAMTKIRTTLAQLHKTSNYVIPAKAGIQYYHALPGFRFPPE
jgi:hypothetical protein